MSLLAAGAAIKCYCSFVVFACFVCFLVVKKIF